MKERWINAHQHAIVTSAMEEQEHDLIIIKLVIEPLSINGLDTRRNGFANPGTHGRDRLPPCIVDFLSIKIAMYQASVNEPPEIETTTGLTTQQSDTLLCQRSYKLDHAHHNSPQRH
jgi:hypothetical protein